MSNKTKELIAKKFEVYLTKNTSSNRYVQQTKPNKAGQQLGIRPDLFYQLTLAEPINKKAKNITYLIFKSRDSNIYNQIKNCINTQNYTKVSLNTIRLNKTMPGTIITTKHIQALGINPKDTKYKTVHSFIMESEFEHAGTHINIIKKQFNELLLHNEFIKIIDNNKPSFPVSAYD